MVDGMVEQATSMLDDVALDDATERATDATERATSTAERATGAIGRTVGAATQVSSPIEQTDVATACQPRNSSLAESSLARARLILSSMREFSFVEAKRLMEADGAVIPFSVVATGRGYDIADHPGSSPGEVYESVRSLLSREQPVCYVLVYDGSLVDGEAVEPAIVCEGACLGDAWALRIARRYQRAAGRTIILGIQEDIDRMPSLYARGQSAFSSNFLRYAS